MSDKGPYDVALGDIESVAVHQSGKTREHQVTVTDDILDTRNLSESEKQKILIKRRAAKDLEELD